MFNRLVKYSLIAFVGMIVSIFLGCSNNDSLTSQGTSGKQVMNLKDVVKPGQIVTVSSMKVSFPQDTMNAKLDSSTNTKAIILGDSVLFVVPTNANEGDHKLVLGDLEINFKSGSIPAVGNATTFMDTIFAPTLADLQNDVLDSSLSSEDKDSLLVIIEAAKNSFSQMTAEQKTTFMVFWEANKQLLYTPSSNRTMATPRAFTDDVYTEYNTAIDSLKVVKERLDQSEENIMKWIVGCGIAGTFLGGNTGPGMLIGAAIGGKITITNFTKATYYQAKIKSLKMVFTMLESLTPRSRAADFTFTNRMAKSFYVNAKYRALLPTDNSGEYSPFFSNISSLNTIWSNLAKTFSRIPFFKTNTLLKESDLDGATETRSIPASELTLSNISNSKVTGSLSSDANDHPVLTFTSSDTTADQNFTFDIAYENQGVSKSVKSFSGIVNKKSKSGIIGTWDISGSGYGGMSLGELSGCYLRIWEGGRFSDFRYGGTWALSGNQITLVIHDIYDSTRIDTYIGIVSGDSIINGTINSNISGAVSVDSWWSAIKKY